MAAGEERPLFEKLRVDTSTPKAVASPFRSITESKQDGVDGSSVAAINSIVQEPLLPSSSITYPVLDPGYAPNHTAENALLSTDDLIQQHTGDHYLKAAEADVPISAGSLSHNSFNNARPRGRGASVSFDPAKTLDDGNRLSLEEPVTKPSGTVAVPRSERADDALPSRSHSESEKLKVNPFTGEPLARRRIRRSVRIEESFQPFPHGGTENIFQGNGYRNYDEPFPLEPKLSNLAVADRTNLAFGHVEDFVNSPLPVSSPISLSYQGENTSAWPDSRPLPARPVPRRTNTLSSSGSLRRANRRASTRSVPSTTSPAGAFLSRWAREEILSTAQPDDEGQEIGDHSEYIIGRQIGYGGFSVVKEAFTIEDGVRLRKAVKIVRKHVSGATELENEKVQAEFEHEVSIWRFLRHQYVLSLIAVYDSPFATFCITQYNEGGTLFDLVKSAREQDGSKLNNDSVSVTGIYETNNLNPSRKGSIPIHLARKYSYQLASALRYLHEDVHVVHRDVKLENCLLDMSAPEADIEGGNVLLCDFGMADFINNDDEPSPPSSPSPSPSPPSPIEAASVPPYADFSEMQDRIYSLRQQRPQQHSSTFPVAAAAAASQSRLRKAATASTSTTSASVFGSLAYMSPESLSCPRPLFWPVVDVWAYGVVLHALLVGSLPFSHAFEPKLLSMILEGEWDEEVLRTAMIEDTAIEVLQGCLQTDIEQRWSIREVLEAYWFDGCKEMLDDMSGLGAW